MSMSCHLALSLLMLSAVQVVSGSVQLDQEDISVNIGTNGELRKAKEGAASTSDPGSATTPLEDLPPITAPPSDAPGTCTATLGNMDKCQSGTEAECGSWSNGLSSGQKLALGAAMQAAGGRLASKLKCSSIRSDCDSLLLQRSTHRHIMRAVSTAPVISEHSRSQEKKAIVRSAKVRKTESIGRGASAVETSDAKACVDPSVADPKTWCCECWASVQSQCSGGLDKGCIHRLMCNNPNVCLSWKNAQPDKCQVTATREAARMLQRSQSNTESDGTRTGNIDHSMVGKCDSEDR